MFVFCRQSDIISFAHHIYTFFSINFQYLLTQALPHILLSISMFLQLMYILPPEQDIIMYLNSPGGSVTAGKIIILFSLLCLLFVLWLVLV